MGTQTEVLSLLDEVLGLKGRTAAFTDDTPLLGALPELDSMTVVSLLAALEERFSLSIDDDEVGAATFASVGSLVEFVENKLKG